MKVTQIARPMGRPVKYSARTVKRLEDSFQIGATVVEACSVAKISTVTYYDWCRSLPDFSLKMTQAQAYSDLFAKKVVAKAIMQDSDLNTSKWWLEKRQYNNKDVIGIETSDGDRTTRFIITRGNPQIQPIDQPTSENPVVVPTTSSLEKDGETLLDTNTQNTTDSV